MKIGIIDYGSGNFTSVYNAIESLSSNVLNVACPNDLSKCSHIVLPGVGTYHKAMERLNQLNLVDELNYQITIKKKPFLGICVGMQILSERGFEFQEAEGLKLIEGEVREFDSTLCKELLPHVGWNSIENVENNPLFLGMDHDDLDFYFVHSFHLNSKDSRANFFETEYGYKFISGLQKENIFGVQFHPEKSQKNGLKLLSNFLRFNA